MNGRKRRGAAFYASVATCLAAVACGDAPQGAAGGPGGGAPPPAEVKTITLEPKAIPNSSEFVATVQSLRSTTIQPQVEGIVTRIFVKSGDRVSPGQPLAQVDPDMQQAAVNSLEAAQAAREADLAYATQQLQRLRTLFEAGAVSRQELEQAETAMKTAEAQLTSIQAQIRESQVQLRYYRITSPTTGVVGDIPVRVGDRVTESTVFTTVDQNQGLEVHIAVPLEQAANLKLGLPVELLDQGGEVIASTKVSFVAPRADEATQAVLVKSLLQELPPSIRVMQYVRARVVWSQEPGLAVPIIAVSRISGAYFCFVAEPQAEGFVARQKPVQVGTVFGDEYVILGGLQAGERVIVSGIQKLGDGAPVKPVA
jgi:RND family efflux transporter MFP subunit